MFINSKKMNIWTSEKNGNFTLLHTSYTIVSNLSPEILAHKNMPSVYQDITEIQYSLPALRTDGGKEMRYKILHFHFNIMAFWLFIPNQHTGRNKKSD